MVFVRCCVRPSSVLRGVERRSQAGSLGEQACDRGTRAYCRPGVGRDGRMRRPPEPEQPRRHARLRLPDHGDCHRSIFLPNRPGGRPIRQTNQHLSGLSPNSDRLTGYPPRGWRQAQSFGFAWPLRLWWPPQLAKPSDCWPCCWKPPLRAVSVPETARSLLGADLTAMSPVTATAMNGNAMNSLSKITYQWFQHAFLGKFYRTGPASTRPPNPTANDSPKTNSSTPENHLCHP